MLLLDSYSDPDLFLSLPTICTEARIEAEVNAAGTNSRRRQFIRTSDEDRNETREHQASRAQQ